MKITQNFFRSIYYFVLAIFNLLLAVIPTFILRKTLLRLLGWKIGQNVSLHRALKITSLTTPCSVGDNSVINRNVLLDNRRRIEIGQNVSISQDCRIYTLGHDTDSDDFRGKGAKVIIDSYAVLFSCATVMPGVNIGLGAVVLPCSVLTKDLPDNAVAGGNPAVVKRYRKSSLKYHLDHRVWFGI